MHALPPVQNSLLPTAVCPWLPPIRFGVKPYLEFSRAIDQGLSELELRYPARRQLLTIEDRQKRILKRKPR